MITALAAFCTVGSGAGFVLAANGQPGAINMAIGLGICALLLVPMAVILWVDR